jgi:prepilin-type N-terminal cleavage/methylation domain-containing protein
MMTSAARTTRSPRGFTLIEIVMVLAIAAVIMGGAVGLMVASSDERVLRDASGEIELMAKQARTISILHQTSYALEFRDGVVRLLPLAQSAAGEGAPSKETSEGNGPETKQYDLEPGLGIFVRRWNSDQWFSTVKDTVHIWRFDPDGLCEPLTIRLVRGESWIEDTFHPLTASISETHMEAR